MLVFGFGCGWGRKMLIGLSFGAFLKGPLKKGPMGLVSAAIDAR